MLWRVRLWIAICLEPQHLRRTSTVMLIVGTWLTVYNQGGILLATGLTQAIMGKILLNYLTPFVVANWGLLSREVEGDRC